MFSYGTGAFSHISATFDPSRLNLQLHQKRHSFTLGKLYALKQVVFRSGVEVGVIIILFSVVCAGPKGPQPSELAASSKNTVLH